MRRLDRQSSLRHLAIGGLGMIPCDFSTVPRAEGKQAICVIVHVSPSPNALFRPSRPAVGTEISFLHGSFRHVFRKSWLPADHGTLKAVDRRL